MSVLEKSRVTLKDVVDRLVALDECLQFAKFPTTDVLEYIALWAFNLELVQVSEHLKWFERYL